MLLVDKYLKIEIKFDRHIFYLVLFLHFQHFNHKFYRPDKGNSDTIKAFRRLMYMILIVSLHEEESHQIVLSAVIIP